MRPIPNIIDRWSTWLQAASLGVSVFGLVFVLAPAWTRQGFSLMLYGSGTTIDAFDTEAVSYVSLVHAVLGGVMVGWGVSLWYAVRSFFHDRPRACWNLVALSLVTWFIPDTAYSLASGYWQNAILNLAFFVLFAIPLWATRRARHR